MSASCNLIRRNGPGHARLLAAGAVMLLLAACNTTGQPETSATAMGTIAAAPAVTVETSVAAPQTPDSRCGRAIDDFARLLSRDLDNGMVARSVHDAAMADLEVAASACRAGSQDQALSALRATRIRHGYPAG